MTKPDPLSASLMIIDVSSKDYRAFLSPFVKLEYGIFLSKDQISSSSQLK